MRDLIRTIARDRLLPPRDIQKIVNGAPSSYKVFQIPKRGSGGLRTIAQPTPEVKELQRWVVDNVLCGLPIHDAAMAYRKGRNIRDNAVRHAQNQFVLRIDFKDFFHSITCDDFLQRIKSADQEFDDADYNVLTKLLFWRPNRYSSDLILSIGAPSSPALSNVVMYEFDVLLSDYCRPRGVVYTRYADDLTFSTSMPNVLRDIATHVSDVIDTMLSPRLVINSKKTVHMSRKGRRFVTGLILTNESKASIGREKKRFISSMVHHFLDGRMPDTEIPRLRGWISFIRGVEPEFLERMKRRYGADRLVPLGIKIDSAD